MGNGATNLMQKNNLNNCWYMEVMNKL